MSRPPCQPDPTDYSLYFHIPFCQQKCRYCAFYSTVGKQDLPRFLQALRREMETRVPAASARTIYIGGGSPSLLTGEQIAFLMEPMAQQFSPDVEVTIEVNPAQASPEFLQALRSHGVNRLSIGAQSFRQEELDFLGRIHRVEQVADAVTNARRVGFDNISLDLIFAIPGSTLDEWRYSLEQAMRLEPQHISAYSLTYEEGTPLYRDLAAGRFEPVSEELDRAMYETAIDTLEAVGYEQVEISNFARAGFACLHNVRCWRNRPYIGLGPSAASWYGGERTDNVADVNEYMERIERGDSPVAEAHVPTAEEIACETAVLGLRMRRGIDRAEYQRRIGQDPVVLFAEAVKENRRAGLLEVTPDCIRLHRRALAIADSVLADFATIT